MVCLLYQVVLAAGETIKQSQWTSNQLYVNIRTGLAATDDIKPGIYENIIKLDLRTQTTSRLVFHYNESQSLRPTLMLRWR